jgi:type IV pilus assembly protein PilV
MKWGMDFRQRGVGLVEVLVSLLVLSVGVLGYAGMQLFALQGAEQSGNRTHATLIARDALERILLNSGDPAALNVYFSPNSWPENFAHGGMYPRLCMLNDCSTVQLANGDVTQLAWMAANSLPGGAIMASDDCAGPPSPSCIVVTWQDMTPQECVNTYPNIPNNVDYTCVVLEAIR